MANKLIKMTQLEHAITPWDIDRSIGHDIRTSGGNPLISAVSTVYPVASKAIFIPFSLSAPMLVKRMFCLNGAAVSGNLDVGIYDAAGTKIVSKGSTAQAGTSTYQILAITNTLLDAGLYYMAIVLDNVTGTFLITTTGNLQITKAMGLAEMGSAFALPATATFATVAADYIPGFGILPR